MRERQRSLKVNLVLLGTEEAVLAEWSVTVFPSPVPGRVPYLQPPVAGRAILGSWQANVLLTPWRAGPAHSTSGQPPVGLAAGPHAALFNSAVFIFMAFKVAHSSLGILLFFSLPRSSWLCCDTTNQCWAQLCASHGGPSIASISL